MYIVAYVLYEQEYSGIHVVTVNSEQELLDLLVNELWVYAPDDDYEPDDNYEEDLNTVLEYMQSNFVGDGSYGVTEITIMKNGEELFVGV